jgi:hypothetical protein
MSLRLARAPHMVGKLSFGDDLHLYDVQHHGGKVVGVRSSGLGPSGVRSSHRTAHAFLRTLEGRPAAPSVVVEDFGSDPSRAPARIYIYLRANVTTLPEGLSSNPLAGRPKGVARSKHRDGEAMRRLAGRPRAFGHAIAVFAHRRAQPPCPHPSRPWRQGRLTLSGPLLGPNND